MGMRRLGMFGLAGALVVASGVAIGGGANAHGEALHPAHIHEGSCETPGEVVIPLGDVSHDYLVDGAVTVGDLVGQETAIETLGSVTTADVPLADIVGQEHVLMVHESAEAIDTYVACGDVGGAMMGPDDLSFGMRPLNDSGLSGIALLHANDDDTTRISVYLTEADLVEDVAAASPETAYASPAADAGAEAADAAEVSIDQFAFAPNMLEIAVGTTVTWTNEEVIPHTVSAVGGGFESGTMEKGATFSFTFEEAGTFEYFCQFHANMTGTVVVS